MAVTILIPTPLRRFSDGARSVSVEAPTVHAALAALADAHPALREQIFEESGGIRPFVNIFLGSDQVPTRTLLPGEDSTAVRDGDTITLVPAIAGGRAS